VDVGPNMSYTGNYVGVGMNGSSLVSPTQRYISSGTGVNPTSITTPTGSFTASSSKKRKSSLSKGKDNSKQG